MDVERFGNLKSDKGMPFKYVAHFNVIKNRYKDPFDREAAWITFINSEFQKGNITKEEREKYKDTGNLGADQSWFFNVGI